MIGLSLRFCFSAKKIPNSTKDIGCILTAYGNAKERGVGGLWEEGRRQMLSVLMYFTH